MDLTQKKAAGEVVLMECVHVHGNQNASAIGNGNGNDYGIVVARLKCLGAVCLSLHSETGRWVCNAAF